MWNEEKSDYVFTWRIKNYSACCHKTGEQLCSPIFKIEKLYESRWFLELYPTGYSDEKCVSFFLTWVDANKDVKKISTDFSIEIVTEKDCVLQFYEIKNRQFEKKGKSWGWATLFPVEELFNEINKSEKDILILRCRIKSDLIKKQAYLGSKASTNIIVDRCFAEWDIKMPVSFKYSESIGFSFLELYQLEITLTSASESVKIGIHLKENKTELPVRITFKMTIFDRMCCKLGSKRAVFRFEIAGKGQFPDFITKEQLELCKTDSSQCEFKLMCEAYASNNNISSDYIVKFTSPAVSKNNPKSEIALQTVFRSIFISKKDSDVTVRAGNEDFPAHKVVLRVRSPVFAAMFDQNMLENQTGVVDITDMDGETMRVFLEFLYTETVNNMDYDIAKKLMLAADKYQVPSLLDECAFFIKAIVSVDNVCEIIMFADLVNCDILKSYALHFIKMNADKILPTSAWTQLLEENIKLGTFILSELAVLFRSEYRFNKLRNDFY